MLKILLPTDFSANARNAIDYAVKLFEKYDCLFYILHTYTPPFYRMDYLIGGPPFSAIPDMGVDISMEGLERTKADIIKENANPKHRFKMVSAFNLLTDEINNLAAEKELDMVVMGTQGASGAREIFLGTNTVYVIRKASIPVMAIPASFDYKQVNKILFPTDYWSKYREEEISTLLDIAEASNAEVTVLHVKEEYELTEKQQENKSHLRSLLKDVTHHFQELRGALMPQAVMDHIDEHQFDLLVMMNRQHGFLERIMWRQNVDQIGFHVQVPFLVIRDTSPINK
ncbi:MAG: universal stress protein [Flavobacteriaceae bacterium]